MRWIEEPGRIYVRDERDEVAAEILFPDVGEGAVCVRRTYVAESLRGQGVAGKLMEAAAASARRRGRGMLAECSYAEAWLSRHPEYRAGDRK